MSEKHIKSSPGYWWLTRLQMMSLPTLLQTTVSLVSLVDLMLPAEYFAITPFTPLVPFTSHSACVSLLSSYYPSPPS